MTRFAHQITVPDSAIDELGHANNVEYVRWIQDAAMAHSISVGLDWADYREIGAVFVIRRHAIEYLRSALAGEALTVETWIDSFTRIMSERGTRITNAAGDVIATAMTTWVFVSLATKRPLRITDDVKRRFGVL